MIFVYVIAIIIGLLIAIPVLVILNTKADANPDHIYAVFLRESGPRGVHISSVFIASLPFVIIANPPDEFMVGVVFVFFAALGLFFHLPVYQGDSVFTDKMRRTLICLVTVLLALSVTARYDLINSNLYIALHIIISFYWGGLAVYKRAKMIKHGKAENVEH